MTTPRREAVPFVLANCEHGTLIMSRLDWRRLDETTHEFGVGTYILTHGSCDIDLIAMTGGFLLASRAARGDGVVALDIGANIGTFTIEWARNMAGWGRVFAYEPQERIYYALAGNLAINNLFNARAFNEAVAEHDGWLAIPSVDYQRIGQLGALSLGGDGSDIGQPTQGRAAVRSIAIDAQRFPRVDFIKIDVEGMEIDVLLGGSDTIERDHPYMLIEWIGVGKEAIDEFLKPLGYDTVTVGMNLMCAPKGDAALARVRGLMENAA